MAAPAFSPFNPFNPHVHRLLSFQTGWMIDEMAHHVENGTEIPRLSRAARISDRIKASWKDRAAQDTLIQAPQKIAGYYRAALPLSGAIERHKRLNPLAPGVPDSILETLEEQRMATLPRDTIFLGDYDQCALVIPLARLLRDEQVDRAVFIEALNWAMSIPNDGDSGVCGRGKCWKHSPAHRVAEIVYDSLGIAEAEAVELREEQHREVGRHLIPDLAEIVHSLIS